MATLNAKERGGAAYDFAVIEVSSFQLETIEQFHPWIAAILNVTVDHMDRYDSERDYIAAKARILRTRRQPTTPCSIWTTRRWPRCGRKPRAG
ncbi:MAG: Mur ligase family protein [Nitrospiraceae bacterium]